MTISPPRSGSRFKSHVAGIVDCHGGLRVVVADKATFHHHVGCDELLIVVPDLRVREPVKWHLIPRMINKVERYVAWWMSTRNDPDVRGSDAVVMYGLRCMENPNFKKSLDLNAIVYT